MVTLPHLHLADSLEGSRDRAKKAKLVEIQEESVLEVVDRTDECIRIVLYHIFLMASQACFICRIKGSLGGMYNVQKKWAIQAACHALEMWA